VTCRWRSSPLGQSGISAAETAVSRGYRWSLLAHGADRLELPFVDRAIPVAVAEEIHDRCDHTSAGPSFAQGRFATFAHTLPDSRDDLGGEESSPGAAALVPARMWRTLRLKQEGAQEQEAYAPLTDSAITLCLAVART